MALVAQPGTEREASQGSSQGNNGSGDGDTGQLSPPISEVPGPNEAPITEPQAHTEQPDPYQFRDLVAQEEMAEWAFWMFVATAAAVVVTAVGVWLVKRTLDTNVGFLQETKDATEAMREANEIARVSSERQLRAYVSINEVAVYDLTPAKKPRYVCIIRNSGQTPAYRLRSIVIVKASEIGPEDYRIRFGTGGAVSVSDLGPGQEIPHTSLAKKPLTQADYKRITSGEVTMIFAGILTYEDAFGRLRRVTFRQHMDVKKELNKLTGQAGLFACVKGNRSN